MATKKLAGAGGSIERTLIRRWARRVIKRTTTTPSEAGVCLELLEWLDKQPRRTAKPGGIGTR